MTTYTWERTRPWLRYPVFLQLQPIQLSHNRCEMYMGVLTQSKKCLDSVCIEINNAHITDTGCGLVWFSCGTVTIKSQCMVTGSITFTTTGLSPLYRFHTSDQNCAGFYFTPYGSNFILNFCSKGETSYPNQHLWKPYCYSLTLISTLMVGKASGDEDDIQVFVDISVT